nr:MMPL family transporter [Mycolicibacterium porcinum]
MTIAGAIFCLSFARLPYFQTMGVPTAVAMVVAVAGAGGVAWRCERGGRSHRGRHGRGHGQG